MADEANGRVKLLSKLATMTGYKGPITDDHEIYYDLRISGDDLDELLIWVQDEFDVDFSRFEFKKYSPYESGEWISDIREAFTGRKLYRSMTVGRLLTAISSHRWVEP